jgi:hypothetical protein
MNELEFAPGEQPLFWLGMTGFAPDQRAVIESSIGRATAMPQWRVSHFREADAWLVNGAKCRVLPDAQLRVAPGLPNEATLHLDMSGVDRPLAFASPLAAPELEPRYQFEPESRDSVQALLLHFDQHLRFARARFALGRQVVELGARLRHGIFHVSHGEHLLAVLDFRRGEAALSPQLQPGQLHDAEWARRPDSAAEVPRGFVPCTTAQMAWSYVRRTARDMLPARYREQTIHYRNTPRVPLRWVRDSQLALLRELQSQPGTLDALRQRTGFPAEQLERDLACLYYAAAVTTTASKASVRAGPSDEDSRASPSTQQSGSQPGDEARDAPFQPEPTVAAGLKPAASRTRR